MSTTERNRSKQRTAKMFKRTIKECLQRPENLTVSKWAEKYRILDESSAQAGRWSNSLTPYLAKIMDCMNNPHIEEINFCKPTQVGGTELLLNILGWVITQNPSPTMLVYPTDDLAKDTCRDRIKPSLLKTELIKESYLERKSTLLSLKFKGMSVFLRGAGSPSKLASKPIKYLIIDEIDKLPNATKKEGDPYSLAKERTRTFAYTKKIITTSTPTVKSNYVWMLHEKAEAQYKFMLPCLHCGELIELKWEQIIYNDKLETPEERAETAKYVCEKCGCEIEDRDKASMERLGEWIDQKGTCKGEPRRVSFHLNALYNRTVRWKDVAYEFENSKDEPDKLQNFYNSWLGLPFENVIVKTDRQKVLERQTETQELVIPEWAKLLTGGIDVQETCLYWTIRAWGDFMTSQNIAHGQALSTEEITRVMNLEYQKASGEKMMVNLALMDSGNDTDTVYEFCMKNLEWCVAVKGASHVMLTHYKLSIVNKANSKANGTPLYIVDGAKYKDMIANRLQKENGPGAWMVYDGCDEEYARQITNEEKVQENGKMMWKPKTEHADNHYLDAEVYAAAAADIKGVRMLHLQNTEKQKQEVAPVQQENQEEQWINQNENWVQGGQNVGNNG